MTTTIIKEGVLNDDTLYVADDNKVFKGGYKAILEYYTFANSWGNHKQARRFKTLQTMNKFITTNYKELNNTMNARDILENFVLWYDHSNVTGINESLDEYLKLLKSEELTNGDIR